MQPVRLYDQPQEFAEMMMRHLRESLNLEVRQDANEPLLLEIQYDKDNEEDKSRVSLHETFVTYMRTGDLNTAIDYLNGVLRCSTDIRDRQEEMLRLDPQFIYPVLRSKEYVEQAGLGSGPLAEESLPGLCMMFLEIKEGYSKIINQEMLNHHPRLTAERVKRLAYRNLRAEGWSYPNLNLQSPFHSSCWVDVYTDPPFPPECQFLYPEMARGHAADSYLIAFTNRKTTILMRAEDPMDTVDRAIRLVKKSRFADVVRRSYRVMPHPVSDRIYWCYKGEFRWLEGV